jgi:hypothetical protein
LANGPRQRGDVPVHHELLYRARLVTLCGDSLTFLSRSLSTGIFSSIPFKEDGQFSHFDEEIPLLSLQYHVAYSKVATQFFFAKKKLVFRQLSNITVDNFVCVSPTGVSIFANFSQVWQTLGSLYVQYIV